MCLIIDTCCYKGYCNNHEDMLQIRRRVRKGQSILVYATTETMQDELRKYPKMKKLIAGYRQDCLKRIPVTDVEREKDKLRKSCKQHIKSNDLDILALANVSNTKLLVTEDGKLIKDFTNSKIVKNGNVYQRKEHEHLLRKHTCRN